MLLTLRFNCNLSYNACTLTETGQTLTPASLVSPWLQVNGETKSTVSVLPILPVPGSTRQYQRRRPSRLSPRARSRALSIARHPNRPLCSHLIAVTHHLLIPNFRIGATTSHDERGPALAETADFAFWAPPRSTAISGPKCRRAASPCGCTNPSNYDDH